MSAAGTVYANANRRDGGYFVRDKSICLGDKRGGRTVVALVSHLHLDQNPGAAYEIANLWNRQRGLPEVKVPCGIGVRAEIAPPKERRRAAR